MRYIAIATTLVLGVAGCEASPSASADGDAMVSASADATSGADVHPTQEDTVASASADATNVGEETSSPETLTKDWSGIICPRFGCVWQKGEGNLWDCPDLLIGAPGSDIPEICAQQ